MYIQLHISHVFVQGRVSSGRKRTVEGLGQLLILDRPLSVWFDKHLYCMAFTDGK